MAHNARFEVTNGLTRTQVAEVLTHLAVYAGSPNIFSTLSVVKVSLKPASLRNSAVAAYRLLICPDIEHFRYTGR